MTTQFYSVTHTPRAMVPGVEVFAWLTVGQANGYVDDLDQLVEVFADYSGEMIPEMVKLSDLQVHGLA